MIRPHSPVVIACAAAAALAATVTLDALRGDARARGEALLLARRALEESVGARTSVPQARTSLTRLRCGAFVILTIGGQTRACAGAPRATAANAAQEIIAAAAIAAAGDPWHRPLGARDLAAGRVEVCLAGPLTPIRNVSALHVARDGLLVRRGPRSAVILPGEARTADWALKQARRKAGLHPNERADLFRFPALRWREQPPRAGKPPRQAE